MDLHHYLFSRELVAAIHKSLEFFDESDNDVKGAGYPADLTLCKCSAFEAVILLSNAFFDVAHYLVNKG